MRLRIKVERRNCSGSIELLPFSLANTIKCKFSHAFKICAFDYFSQDVIKSREFNGEKSHNLIQVENRLTYLRGLPGILTGLIGYFFIQHFLVNGARGGVVIKVLHYKPAGRGFDSR